MRHFFVIRLIEEVKAKLGSLASPIKEVNLELTNVNRFVVIGSGKNLTDFRLMTHADFDESCGAVMGTVALTLSNSFEHRGGGFNWYELVLVDSLRTDVPTEGADCEVASEEERDDERYFESVDGLAPNALVPSLTEAEVVRLVSKIRRNSDFFLH